jgi:hypothetical protein
MIELCRLRHRHDLVSEYQEAWETAALAMYGKLPARPERRIYQPATAAEQPKRQSTNFRAEMLSKPLKKIIGRIGDFELLECGHQIWQPKEFLFDDVNHRRRRCGECAKAKQQAKKPPSAATEKLGRKEGTA